ncbi:DUF1883 domain-containing protein [Saccharopolyspora sp. NFXS83]|uniref:DUF1883 domain-containing protein n=1 Tax=Saccharopolyspora sp. NFXS83 TaxID=2993560 RepID=UPI00224A987F|nr:DUF1883 domain-containing protein [Saccharopolyspora sp. NFXS83]MCX2728821.1 DUF1883 domain-containing protein [Saccharopolyspora sp. NFXS83]
MEHLWWDLGLCTAGTDVEVELRGVEAFVRLLDADNYKDYLDDDEYTYYGGVWQTSPVVLEVPYDGHWYLVVDGYEGRIKVRQVTTIPG